MVATLSISCGVQSADHANDVRVVKVATVREVNRPALRMMLWGFSKSKPFAWLRNCRAFLFSDNNCFVICIYLLDSGGPACYNWLALGLCGNGSWVALAAIASSCWGFSFALYRSRRPGLVCFVGCVPPPVKADPGVPAPWCLIHSLHLRRFADWVLFTVTL